VIDPAIWPLETSTDRRSRIRIDGVDLVALAERFGTPLYLYDAATIRDAYRRYGAAFKAMRPVRISYAIKACALRGVASILAAAGADASAASLGELLAAKRAGFAPARTQLHGNAKTDEELRAALRLGVGRIVIDGADEIDRLRRLVARRAHPQDVWLRVSPGIGADTHPHLRTGVLDSKFGAPIAGGDALAHCRAIAATKNLRLVGIHAHLGTQLHEADRYRELGAALAALARDVRAATGTALKEIAVGGGLAVALRSGDPVLDLAAYARAISEPIRSEASLRKAVLYLEPGRSLVGRAASPSTESSGPNACPVSAHSCPWTEGWGTTSGLPCTARNTPRSSPIARRRHRPSTSRSPGSTAKVAICSSAMSRSPRPSPATSSRSLQPARTASRWRPTTTTTRVRRSCSSTAVARR